MNKHKKILMFALIFLGFIITVKLAIIFHSANYNDYALPSFCSINDFVDCDGIAKTRYSQAFGIPLAYWGIFLYSILAFLCFVDKLKNIKYLGFLNVFKQPIAYISSISLLAFFCSIILAIISLYIIKKICILCVATYFIDLLIALLAADLSLKNAITYLKTTLLDIIDGAKKYVKTTILLVLTMTCFLTYSTVTYNFVPKLKDVRSIQKYRKMKFNPYRVKGNELGNPNGVVIVELYSDFVCPLCYINNIMLHKAVSEFSNVRVIHYNYPFDKECNPYISINMHPHACFMSKAALAAKKQNNYWEMSSLLYEKKPKKIEKLLELVEELKFDKEKFLSDFYSIKTIDELSYEISKASEKEIDATPTMIINGDLTVGVKPYHKLKEILKSHGAK